MVAPDGAIVGPAFGIQDAKTIEAEMRDLLG
jgi:hypothetical protein